MSNRKTLTLIALAAGVIASAVPSHAYRMLQNFNTGRQTSGNLVPCNDAGGFVHWNQANTLWYHNTANKGSGKDQALFSAMNVWNFVPGASHTLTYKARTNAGFITDGFNVVSWGTNSGCGTGCLALTAVVLHSGQVIQESDIIFNNNYNWTTNGTNYDTWAVASHEFGHTLGIHHSDVPGATMYQGYQAQWNILEPDDKAALQCSQNRYPPAVSCIPDGGTTDGSVACCSGYTVTGSSHCNGDGCFQLCASVPPGGCAAPGGMDDTWGNTSCCSGASVPFSTRCLNPADYNNGWATCIHTCQ